MREAECEEELDEEAAVPPALTPCHPDCPLCRPELAGRPDNVLWPWVQDPKTGQHRRAVLFIYPG